MKSEYRRKQEAKKRASKDLQLTKKRLGVGPPKPLRGATPDPLVASTWERKPTPAPTSDRIPGSAPAGDFMHAHKWKRHARETEATVKEIRRKASKIAPAYNKGALQYLPDEKDR
jgi:hypothetical protein